MDDLTVWLRAQLGEDEAACRREINGPVHDGPCVNYLGQDPDHYDDLGPCVRHANRYRPYTDPQRGRAEVEAKRRILDEIVDEANGLDSMVDHDRRVGRRDEVTEPYLGDMLVKLLALPYADRAGYREEWRPAKA